VAGRRLYWAYATIMNAFLAAFLFLAGALGATLFGFLLRNKLPEHHVSEHSRSIIVLSTKLIATMTALLLGLLVSSANDSLQSFNSGLEQMGARLATTDRLLKDYGPETREVRHSLREHAALSVAVIWPEERERLVSLNLFATGQLPRSGWDGAVRDASHAVRALAISSFLPEIEGKLLDLKPQDEAKRWRQAEALRQLGPAGGAALAAGRKGPEYRAGHAAGSSPGMVAHPVHDFRPLRAAQCHRDDGTRPVRCFGIGGGFRHSGNE
jgi:hypothetical protein